MRKLQKNVDLCNVPTININPWSIIRRYTVFLKFDKMKQTGQIEGARHNVQS